MTRGVPCPPEPTPRRARSEYLVIEFPPGHPTGENLPLVVDLVDRGLVRLLDLAFVRRDYDGSVTVAELTDLDGDGDLDLAVFEGASSGVIELTTSTMSGPFWNPAARPPSSSSRTCGWPRWPPPCTAAARHRPSFRNLRGRR